MEQTLTKEINGGSYTFTPLPADPGIRIFRKLHGYMAPAVGAIAKVAIPAASEGMDFEGLLEAGSEDIAQAVSQLVEHVGRLIADDEFADLMQTTFMGVTFNGKELAKDHFAPMNRLADYDQVVLWCVWQNFGRIFIEGVGNLPNLAARAAALFPTPST